MNLVIDQGNTLTKIAVFDQNEIIDHKTVNVIRDETIEAITSQYSIRHSIISSVKDEVSDQMLKKHKFLKLSHLTAIPLLLKYETIDTLGLDRIAAAVGAKYAYPKTNLLVIDMGTCITSDFLNDEGEYLGGSISLGLNMRLKALNQFTGKLPLVEFNKENLRLTGNSTESSIISGVYNGIKNELEGTINMYKEQYSDLKVVLTGGDVDLFDIATKNCIFADSFLVLKGLNEILNYNEKN